MSGIKGLLFIVILISSTVSLLAQPALLRSGEHSNFSRLTISTKSIESWTLDQAEAQYTINFSNFQGGFDISKIYERIDRTRIQNVRSTRSSIEFDLACTCDVDIFEANPNMIVIDVKDRGPEPSISRGLKMEQKVNYKPVLRLPIDNSDASLELKSSKNTPIFRYSDKVLKKYEATISTEFKGETHPIDLSSSNLPETEILIGDLQTHLINGFGAASTRGILDLSPDASNSVSGKKPPLLTGMNLINTNPDLANNFSIISSLEPEKTHKRAFVTEGFDLRCTANNRFDISEWSDGRPFKQQLSDANAKLFNSLDALEVEAAVKLTRLYLFYGFGAEAKKIISLDARIHTHWPELSAISDILEGKESTASSFFANKLECKGPVALWTALANPISTSSLDEDRKSILLELSKLPIHLRIIAAPKISAYLLNANDPLLAQSALQTLERTEYPFADDASFAEGILLKANRKPEAALEKFAAIESNSLVSAKALLEKTHLQLEGDLEIAIKSLDLIDGYATEFRGTSMGIELQEVSILALSRSSQFAKALQRAKQEKSNISVEIFNKIYQDIVEFAEDRIFVEYAINQVPSPLMESDPNLAYQYANRLYNLGFYEESEELLITPTIQLEDVPATILKAKISIALGQPAAAAVLLNKLGGSDVDHLKARIDSMQGNHEKAAKSYNALGDIDQELAQNWLSNRWQTSTQAENSIMLDLANVVTTSINTVTRPDDMLGQIEGMLDESRQSRNTIENLLKDPDFIMTK